jgi:hypothetical protein
MSTYKQIAGTTVKAYTTNPSDPQEGEMWYNQTTLKLRGVTAVGAWSSASPTTNAKQRPGGCGTQTAGLACGGSTAPPASGVATTEEYNGSGWTTASNINTARGNTKLIGTQTAAVFSGKGSPSVPYAGTTELYDGTTWTTNPNSANDTYNYRSGCGTQTAALLSGGNYPPTNRAAGNEEFDGTSFSEGGDLPQKQSSQGQAGTQTAAINSFGATNSPVPGNSGDADNAISLEYDGSTWTSGPNGNSVVPLSGYAMGSGTQTDAIFAGGPPVNSCKYDGTTFSVGPALATAQPSSAHASASASATWIAHGSPVPSVGTDTQEFNFSAQVITAGAWASAPSLNTGRTELMGVKEGTQTAALACGGQPGTTPPIGLNNSEEYNGTSWTEGNNLNTARKRGSSNGTQTAGLTAGGSNTAPIAPGSQNVSEEYDGTSWSEGNNLSTARYGLGGSGGPQTASIVAGGSSSTAKTTLVEEYDGTSWTSGTAIPTATNDAGGAGTSTAFLFAGGNSTANIGDAFNYDGSSWTTNPSSLTYEVRMMASSGSSTSAIFSGGEAPSDVSTVNIYDGTVFATAPTLGTARGRLSGAGTTTAAIVYGGDPVSSAAEEFTGETTSANLVDITTAE